MELNTPNKICSQNLHQNPPDKQGLIVNFGSPISYLPDSPLHTCITYTQTSQTFSLECTSNCTCMPEQIVCKSNDNFNFISFFLQNQTVIGHSTLEMLQLKICFTHDVIIGFSQFYWISLLEIRLTLRFMENTRPYVLFSS